MTTEGVNIPLKVTADDSGAKQIERALGIVIKSEQELLAARSQFLTAAQAEGAELNRLVESSKRAAAAREEETRKIAAQDAAAKRLAESYHLNEQALNRMTTSGINPWTTASAGARTNVDNLSASQVRAAGSSRNMGNALLQASRGLQDMQYGLAGAVNNLEGIASALGLGAGVAGVVTVLAVAVQTLGPHVLTWLRSLDTEGAKLDNLVAGLKRVAEAIKGDYSANADNAKRVSDAFSDSLKKESDALEANARALDENQKLLKRRADLQKTADQQKLDADIEDIKSQKLPPQQERNAIATRKREALDANKAREDQVAASALSTGTDKLIGETKNRDALKAQQAGLEKEKALANELVTLQEERAELEAKAAAKKQHLDGGRGDHYDPQGERDLQAMQRKIEADKAREKEIIDAAPEGRIRKVEKIDEDLDKVKPLAKAASDQTAKDAAALQAARDAERLAKVGRQNTYEREAEKIAREAQGGVMDDGNLPLPKGALDQGPAPLPPGAAPGSKLPAAPFQPAELNPPRVSNTAPPVPFGPQPVTAETPVSAPAPAPAPVPPAPPALSPEEGKRHQQLIAEYNESLERQRNGYIIDQATGGMTEDQQRQLAEAKKNPGGGYDAEQKIQDRISAELDPLDEKKRRKEAEATAPPPLPKAAESGAAPSGQSAPQNAQGGGQALPGADKIVNSNNKANDALMKVADAMEKSNAAVMKRLAALEGRLRSQALMS